MTALLFSTRRHSLTARLTLTFASLAFASLVCLGYALYRELEAELVRRDDAALIGRVEQLRTLLADSNAVELIKNKPGLFQNMLGNRESLLTLGAAGQPPLLVVNPGNLSMPTLTPAADDHPLGLGDVQHYEGKGGVPIAVLSARVDSEDMGTLQVVAARMMTERTSVLASYRLSVYLLAGLAAAVLALSSYVVVRRGLRPIHRFAQHAQGVGMSSLSERLDGHDAPAELLPMVDAFNGMLERLAKGFLQLGQVSTDMAHELRTPVNNLLGEIQVALHQDRSVEDYQQLLASNVEELERLARMLDNMLFLARTDPGSAMSQRQSLEAADEVERMSEYFEGPAADADVQIIGQGQGTLWAEPMLLRRALANLCSNAIKYATPGSAVYINAVAAQDGVRIRVTNTGPTIGPEHLPRLFERFYRVDPSRARSADSNGLGLSIVATIMQLHHGSYQVGSAENSTWFELFFPARNP